MPQEISASVRRIVEFVYKHGDIHTVFLSSSRAVDGIKAHQKTQKRFAEELTQYEAELSISSTVTMEELSLFISGRIDGVYLDDDVWVIDEIKSVSDLSYIDTYDALHMAQGKMYAHIYAQEKGLEKAVVQVTYAELGSGEIKQFSQQFTAAELQAFFTDTVRCYIAFAKKNAAYSELSKKSIEEITFPFKSYREGQRKLMASVYQIILQDERLFARAPTGIGKTMSTLFPAIKSLLKEPGKIFYLTAKTIGRDVAEKALDILEDNGLNLKRVTITAKEKICLNGEKICDGEYCPYAKGHFDRINDALTALIDDTNRYDREVITQYAQRYQVCPYELTLDLSLFSDCIICDYNYAFDPSSVLKRFFAEDSKQGRYVFLIDEAHNLVERARSMYSGEMSKKAILSLKNKIKDKDKVLHRYLTKMNQFLIDKRHEYEAAQGYLTEKEFDEEFADLARGVVYRTEKIYARLADWEHADELLTFYFDTYDFLRKTELYDERYVTYYEKHGSEVMMKLFCLDPSHNLAAYMDNADAAVLFSATLTPMNYFINILGGGKQSHRLTLRSPFDADNLCLLIDGSVSTKYADRERTYDQIVETICGAVGGKKGNYIVYFPSYRYMEDVFERYIASINEDEIQAVRQERGLTEPQKEAFLSAFYEQRENTYVAFAVMGGMFGEGIDLQGDVLSGAIIVGVGLPSICLERDLIKQHFDQTSCDGFRYAYMYPGMNKVMQAAGRVIRTHEDVGIVVLIDERFNQRYYHGVFPPEWRHAKRLRGHRGICETVEHFWQKKESSV